MKHATIRLVAAIVIALLTLGAGLAAAQSAGSELSLYREETVVTAKFPGDFERKSLTRSWIKGDRMRTEVAEGKDITIIRPDLGLVFTINAERKVYAETPIEIFRRAARLSLAILGTDPTYRWTNRTKTIGKWQCREVVLTEESSVHGERLKTTWWIGDDLGFDQTTFARIMKVTTGTDLGPEGEKFLAKLTSIPGFPVRTESSFTRGGITVKTTNTLLKLERREIDDSRFDPPVGYTKIVVPTPGTLQ